MWCILTRTPWGRRRYSYNKQVELLDQQYKKKESEIYRAYKDAVDKIEWEESDKLAPLTREYNDKKRLITRWSKDEIVEANRVKTNQMNKLNRQYIDTKRNLYRNYKGPGLEGLTC